MWIAIIIAIAFVIIILAKRMNNYALVARNTTFIYEILKDDFKESFPDDVSLLSTTAVIDAFVYLHEGQLTIDEINRGVQCAKAGKCYLGPAYYVDLDGDAMEYMMSVMSDEHNTFLCFILQLEALLFRIDSRVSPDLILDAVKSKKKSISKIIKSTQKKYRKSGASQAKKKQVHSFMTGDSFIGLRKELNIKTML